MGGGVVRLDYREKGEVATHRVNACTLMEDVPIS